MRGARERSAIPGFGLSLGITITYLGLIVLIPLAALVLRVAATPPAELFASVTSARALAAFRLSFSLAATAAALNAVFGLLLAWVLERTSFPGRKLVDGLIDLPFALPTAVAGIALTTMYAESGWIGGALAALGIRVAFTPLGIVVALVFVGLPFVVRTVQPVLRDLPRAVEEAAESLGASHATTFARVIFPELRGALVSGFTLAFARGLGEYGSVIFIAGNMPFETEIAPLLIVIRLEEYDYAGATALALFFLVLSFALLFAINAITFRRERTA